MNRPDLPPHLRNLDLKEFKMIYPLYINSNRTQQQGRRINKEKAVPDPNVHEIEQVLSKIPGARIIIELDKRHPREINFEQTHFLGRVRVSLPENSGIENKYHLLLYIADEISKMERKKFKVQQIVEPTEQSATTTKSQTSNTKNAKKQVSNRKKNSRKK